MGSLSRPLRFTHEKLLDVHARLDGAHYLPRTVNNDKPLRPRVPARVRSLAVALINGFCGLSMVLTEGNANILHKSCHATGLASLIGILRNGQIEVNPLLSPCHPRHPRHLVTLSPCHLVTLSPCHPCHLVTLSPPSPCHPVTLSPPSPCHPVTLSPCHLVTLSSATRPPAACSATPS